MGELSNGNLIRAGEENGFELLLTSDKNMRYQQNPNGRRIAIVVIGNAQWPVLRDLCHACPRRNQQYTAQLVRRNRHPLGQYGLHRNSSCEQLAEELKELAISPTELARQIGVPANRVTQILKGSRAITADTALRLGHYFGVSPHFWLNLQNLYDLRIAERTAGRKIRTLPKLRESIPA